LQEVGLLIQGARGNGTQKIWNKRLFTYEKHFLGNRIMGRRDQKSVLDDLVEIAVVKSRPLFCFTATDIPPTTPL